MSEITKTTAASEASEVNNNLQQLLETLASLGIKDTIAPQKIVVCGDRSSGKTSVLSAIFGFLLPIDDLTGTICAIEVHLEKSTETTFTARIRPSKSRAEEEATSLRNWRSSGMSSLATKALAAFDQIKGASAKRVDEIYDDVVVFKWKGPSLTNVTIIDLPGKSTQ
jgi:hypothetical protein